MHLSLTFRRRCSSLRRRSSNEGRRCLLLLLAQSGHYAMSQWRAVTSHSRIILADVITEQIARDGEAMAVESEHELDVRPRRRVLRLVALASFCLPFAGRAALAAEGNNTTKGGAW